MVTVTLASQSAKDKATRFYGPAYFPRTFRYASDMVRCIERAKEVGVELKIEISNKVRIHPKSL